MTCSTCGRDNPAHLTFCQECGQRLGPRIAPPTPPIGLGVGAGDDPHAPPVPIHQPRTSTSLGMTQSDPFAGPAPSPAPPPVATGAPRRCKVCDTSNAPNLRYCTSCGSSLEAIAVPNAALQAAAAPAGAYGPPPAPAASPPAPAPGALPPPADAIAVGRVVDLGGSGPGPQGGVRTCVRCRGAVDPAAQFCKFCGASLAESGPHARAPVNGNAKPIAPPTPLAAFAPQGVNPVPSPSPIGGSGSSPSAYGPPPAQPVSPSAGPPVPAPAAAPTPAPPPPAGPAPVAPAAKPATLPTRGKLVVIAKSGADGPSYPFADSLDVGRAEGHVIVGEDPYLSPRHVRIAHANGKVFLRDLGSTNGVFLRVAAGRDISGGRGPEVSVPLQDQDLILVGQQVLRFDVLREGDTGLGAASEHGTLLFGSPAAPRYARLSQRTVEGVTRDVYYLRKMETVLGRESGDVVFTEDPFLSRRHAAVRALGRDGSPLAQPAASAKPDIAKFALVDLGSSNGTFLRIRNEIELLPGDQFRVGQQLFRVDMPGT